jgi:hypothetical protein
MVKFNFDVEFSEGGVGGALVAYWNLIYAAGI